jgi:prepilin-type N-terminal cleavage/methylation domain-containing protein
MKLNCSRRAGFTLVELMIVCFVISLIAAIAVPSFIHARNNSRKNICISNLRQINNAKASWSGEKAVLGNALPTDADLFGPDKYVREKPVCPIDGDYTLETLDKRPTCSYGPTYGHKL